MEKHEDKRGGLVRPAGVESRTPTPVRGTGTTEQLSSHRADDTRNYESLADFDRDLLSRPDESPWRGPQRLMKRTKHRSSR